MARRPSRARQPLVAAWAADAHDGRSKYVALFDTGDAGADVAVAWRELGLSGKRNVRDLWARRDLGTFEGSFSTRLNPHAAGLYELTAAK